MHPRYKEKLGDLFTNAGHGSVLVHACAANDNWNAGIAKKFDCLYLLAAKQFRQYTRGLNELGLPQVGTVHVSDEDGRWIRRQNRIGSLITSKGFGRNTDSAAEILRNTRSAVDSLLYTLDEIYAEDSPVYVESNKFNSGLFRVPWEETRNIILEALEHRPRVHWTVWSIDNAKP